MKNRLTGTNDDVPTLVFVDRISINYPILFSLADRIHDLISLPLSFFQSSPPKEKAAALSKKSSTTTTFVKNNCSSIMSKEEVKFVMEKIELIWSKEIDDDDDEKFKEFGGDDLTAMFEESEPSLEELKQTFNVFDKNKDGFIDAEELHRVLTLLVGSNQGLFIHDCQRMISRFDHNNDGKIDFNEFVMFMEIAFSS